MLPRFQNCETLVVMEPELVRIGGFEISKVVFETAALLTSVIIGGLISYLTTWAADKRKWRQHQKDKHLEQQREALALTLEWIQPIQSVLMSNFSIATALIRGDVDRHEFKEQWPAFKQSIDLMGEDIPSRLQVHIPPKVYKKRNDVLRQLEELRSYILLSSPMSFENVEERLSEFLQREATVEQSFAALKQELKEEYEKTFR